MNESIETMLARYNIQSSADCLRAVREIMQEIALVGLWRAKFFEHAAFYGGTALRILYGLDRFSEDLDFSLLTKKSDFDFEPYTHAMETEFAAFGFEVEIQKKQKTKPSQIESAFIKANTMKQLLNIGFKHYTLSGLPRNAKIQIKCEIDTDPPPGFKTEAKILKEPLPISVNTYVPTDLFAGKMHAVLCRLWQKRVKGRDWYDLIWFIRKDIPLNLKHLEQRMWQSGCLNQNTALTKPVFLEALAKKIDELDISNAQQDMQPFVAEPELLQSWSKAYFHQFIDEIKIV